MIKNIVQSSCYYHHQIISINLTHCYHIFPWLCAWDGCYVIFCHLLHIHLGILFSLLLCSLWWVQIVGYVLACISCSFVFLLYHIIIIILQHYLKTWGGLSIFSQSSIVKYKGLCVFSLPISLVMIEKIHFALLSSSNWKYEILSIV